MSLQLTEPTARKKEKELWYERRLECSVMGKSGKTKILRKKETNVSNVE
jgi:hypothetical protein